MKFPSAFQYILPIMERQSKLHDKMLSLLFGTASMRSSKSIPARTLFIPIFLLVNILCAFGDENVREAERMRLLHLQRLSRPAGGIVSVSFPIDPASPARHDQDIDGSLLQHLGSARIFASH